MNAAALVLYVVWGMGACFFDGLEVNKTKMGVSMGSIQPPTTHGREAIMRC